jgi:hypothetical protein
VSQKGRDRGKKREEKRQRGEKQRGTTIGKGWKGTGKRGEREEGGEKDGERKGERKGRGRERGGGQRGGKGGVRGREMREGKRRGEGLGAAVVFTSLKGQWYKIFGLSFCIELFIWEAQKEDSFEQI